MTRDEQSNLQSPPPEVKALRQRLLNLAVLARIRKLLAIDAENQLIEARVWRCAWLVLIVACIAGVAYGLLRAALRTGVF